MTYAVQTPQSILGEVGKVVPVSRERIMTVESAGSGVRLQVRGVEGEQVSMAFWLPLPRDDGGGVVRRVSCEIAADGLGRIAIAGAPEHDSKSNMAAATMKTDDNPTTGFGRTSTSILGQQPQRVGDSWGTEIHWHKLFSWNASSSGTSPEEAHGEAAMIARAFKLARMDLRWAAVEKRSGVYEFAGYDALLSVMQAHGLRPFWILDYG